MFERYRKLKQMNEQEVVEYAKQIRTPLALVKQVQRDGKLPVVLFAAGGNATPADAALMMQLGMDGVFVGSGIFKSSNSAKMARAIVQATTHYNLGLSERRLGEPMHGINERWSVKESD